MIKHLLSQLMSVKINIRDMPAALTGPRQNPLNFSITAKGLMNSGVVFLW